MWKITTRLLIAHTEVNILTLNSFHPQLEAICFCHYQMESGEVKVDRDGEGSLTKEGEEREMESDEVKFKQDGIATRRAER